MVLTVCLAVMHLTLWVPASLVASPALATASAHSVRLTDIHALPDPFAIAILMGTLIAILAWRIGALKPISAGAVVGVLRSRLLPLPGVRSAL